MDRSFSLVTWSFLVSALPQGAIGSQNGPGLPDLVFHLHSPLGVVLMSTLILGLLSLAIYSLSRSDVYYDPLYAGELVGGSWGRDLFGQGLPASNWQSLKGLHQTGEPQRDWRPPVDWGISGGLPLLTWGY